MVSDIHIEEWFDKIEAVNKIRGHYLMRCTVNLRESITITTRLMCLGNISKEVETATS